MHPRIGYNLHQGVVEWHGARYCRTWLHPGNMAKVPPHCSCPLPLHLQCVALLPPLSLLPLPLLPVPPPIACCPCCHTRCPCCPCAHPLATPHTWCTCCPPPLPCLLPPPATPVGPTLHLGACCWGWLGHGCWWLARKWCLQEHRVASTGSRGRRARAHGGYAGAK